MTMISTVSRNWQTRPDDERFVSLTDMHGFMSAQKRASNQHVVANRLVTIAPLDHEDPNSELVMLGRHGAQYALTHWAMGQLSARAEAPARYLRELPAALAADCLNYGMHFKRSVDEVGLLVTRDGDGMGDLRAATGPNYGRIWNVDVLEAVMRRFGDGVSGDWRVPGPFRERLETVTKENTTLFASDRDMLLFLTYDEHRIEVKNRRNGQPGELSRGFIIGNSEVGDGTMFVAMFLYDYMCSNRNIWGVSGFEQIKVRHTAGAPMRFVEEIIPVVNRIAHDSTAGIQTAIHDAQEARLNSKTGDVSAWLRKRFNDNRSIAEGIQRVHMMEEGRPVETVWDAVVGATAYARSIPHQNDRLSLERTAGDLMKTFLL